MKQGLQETSKLKRLAIYAKILKLINTHISALAEFDASYSVALLNKYRWPNFNELSHYSAFPNYLKPS
jgi:hypothetical protein